MNIKVAALTVSEKSSNTKNISVDHADKLWTEAITIKSVYEHEMLNQWPPATYGTNRWTQNTSKLARRRAILTWCNCRTHDLSKCTVKSENNTKPRTTYIYIESNKPNTSHHLRLDTENLLQNKDQTRNKQWEQLQTMNQQQNHHLRTDSNWGYKGAFLLSNEISP